MIVGAEADALTIDAAAFGQAMSSFRSGRDDGIRTYIDAMLAVPLSARPISIGGSPAMMFDPLSKRPELRQALSNAKDHAFELSGNLVTLHNWATGGAAQMAGFVKDPLLKIRAFGDAILTPAQAGEVAREISMAALWAQMIAEAMKQINYGVRNFLGSLVVDHDTLANGPLELRHAAEEVGSDISKQAMPYVLNPVTSGIGNTMLQIGREVMASFHAVAAVIQKALAGHEAMRGGASALGVAAATVQVKYQAAAKAVGKGDFTKLPESMRPLQIDKAIKSWDQFVDFFNRSGL